MVERGKGTCALIWVAMEVCFFFSCNFDINDYPKLPKFYSELLQWWFQLRKNIASEKDWIHIIWNNKQIPRQEAGLLQ